MKELLEQIKEKISDLDVDKIDFDKLDFESRILLKTYLRQMLSQLQFIKEEL